ncbi:hypothetical protein FNV43_RR02104 [Rhamnella rubrinervis]|uniref:Uncharacterized protein n=1 Tax=Rhamnella rubrinervis TaxID=2594499 RepID=A0A8K0MSN8_9ROSA|nr:hypothetical protein FNV43_RR02104 [Rhamnella rubrinervis]
MTTNQLIAVKRLYNIPLDVTLRELKEGEVPSQPCAGEMTITILAFYCGPKKPHDLLAKFNNIMRLEVQCRMKKFILFPEHMITYVSQNIRSALRGIAQKSAERFSRPSSADPLPPRSLRSKGKGVAVTPSSKKRARSPTNPASDLPGGKVPEDLLTFAKKARTFLTREMREDIRGEGMIGQLDECANSSLKLTYSIFDVVEKNRKLNMEVDNTNKALNDSLDTNKKLEANSKMFKRRKLPSLSIMKNKLEKKLEVTEREVQELRSDYKNQLVIGFELMKAAFKTVEPKFVLKRLDKANLESLYPVVLAKVSGVSPPKISLEARPEEDVTRREGHAKASLLTPTSTGREPTRVEASVNASGVEEERREEEQV